MRILVSGATGLLGSALMKRLHGSGHTVIRLLRTRHAGSAEPVWDPAAGHLDPASVEGFDAVVHLAGENVAAGRWTAERKRRIRESRVASTDLLCQTLAALAQPPKVLISASAIGYYGNRGDEELDERSAPGRGFLADVCTAWEQATQSAEQAGIRVLRLRLGMVLSAEGGALAKMLPPFRRGLGGRLGDGRAYMSWVALEEVLGVIEYALATPALSGPVNVVAPQPVRNRDFTKILGRVLRRPAWLAVPAPAIRLLFGEMGTELLLSSAKVLPRQLTDSGYTFRFPSLEAVLNSLLRPGTGAPD